MTPALLLEKVLDLMKKRQLLVSAFPGNPRQVKTGKPNYLRVSCALLPLEPQAKNAHWEAGLLSLKPPTTMLGRGMGENK
jgi:hypothetical protein